MLHLYTLPTSAPTRFRVYGWTALLILSLFVACNKDTTEEKLRASESSLSTGRWQLQSATSQYTAGGQLFKTDVYANTPACQRDNFLIFKTDKTLTRDEGATKCAPNDPQITEGKWLMQFDGVTTLLSYTPDGVSLINAEVTALTPTTLRLRYIVNTGVSVQNEVEYVNR